MPLLTEYGTAYSESDALAVWQSLIANDAIASSFLAASNNDQFFVVATTGKSDYLLASSANEGNVFTTALITVGGPVGGGVEEFEFESGGTVGEAEIQLTDGVDTITFPVGYDGSFVEFPSGRKIALSVGVVRKWDRFQVDATIPELLQTMYVSPLAISGGYTGDPSKTWNITLSAFSGGATGEIGGPGTITATVKVGATTITSLDIASTYTPGTPVAIGDGVEIAFSGWVADVTVSTNRTSWQVDAVQSAITAEELRTIIRIKLPASFGGILAAVWFLCEYDFIGANLHANGPPALLFNVKDGAYAQWVETRTPQDTKVLEPVDFVPGDNIFQENVFVGFPLNFLPAADAEIDVAVLAASSYGRLDATKFDLGFPDVTVSGTPTVPFVEQWIIETQVISGTGVIGSGSIAAVVRLNGVTIAVHGIGSGYAGTPLAVKNGISLAYGAGTVTNLAQAYTVDIAATNPPLLYDEDIDAATAFWTIKNVQLLLFVV